MAAPAAWEKSGGRRVNALARDLARGRAEGLRATGPPLARCDGPAPGAVPLQDTAPLKRFRLSSPRSKADANVRPAVLRAKTACGISRVPENQAAATISWADCLRPAASLHLAPEEPMRRHHLQVVLQFVLTALLVAGIHSSASAADTVRVGKPAAAGFIFTFAEIGMATGIYPANGISVESVAFGGGGPAHQALAAGSIEFVFGAGSEMQLAAKGAPELAVASIMRAPAQIALAVKSNSPIKSPADLKGKSVGVSSSTSLTAWCTHEMSRREGWGADGITAVPLGAFEAGMAQLTTGNIDGLTGQADQLEAVEALGRVRIILQFSEYVPDFPAFVIYAAKPLIDDKPDVVRRYLKGTLETLAFMREHKAETLKLAEPIMHVTDEVASKVYDTQMPAFTDGHFTPSSMTVLRRSMVELGLLDPVPPDNVLFTERFLPQTQ